MLDHRLILSTKGLRTAVGKPKPITVEDAPALDESKLLTTQGLRTAVGKPRV
jgi:hypothetical protein